MLNGSTYPADLDSRGHRLPGQAEACYDERIYRNTLDSLLEVVRGTDDGVRSLLLVSHNPGAQQLSVALTAEAEPYEGFPTCALALIELTGPWASVSEGAGRLVRLWSPPGSETS